MAPRTLPGLGLSGFAPKGEDDWNAWADGNWRVLSALTQARVTGLVASLPGSPTNGQIYILTAGADLNKIALRDNGAWVYLTPQVGWRVYDQTNALFYTFNGATWAPDFADLSATNDAAAVEIRKKGSTTGANAPNAAFASLGAFRWLGWTGSAWRVGAAMLVQTQQLWSGVANGTAIVWQVIANGTTTLVDRLQLTATALQPAQTDGVVSLGSATTRWLRGWFKEISINPDSTPWPDANGEIVIASYADDTITILKKGSDGIVRSVDLTLTEV